MIYRSKIFTSSKRFGPISTGHRQWRHDGHCSFVHGYGRIVEITFGCEERDERGWVVDFGDLRDVKEWLEEQWDHRLLIAYDDPLLEDFYQLNNKGGISINVMPEEYGPGIEDSADYVFDRVDRMIRTKTNGRAFLMNVKVKEHENNWAEAKSVKSK